MEVLKVSSKSNPNSCAGAMAGVIRQDGAVQVQVVGAGALNQAVKAIAIARGYLAPTGIDLVCVPTFKDIEIDGESRTAICLQVEDREQRIPKTLDLRDGNPIVLERPSHLVNGASPLAASNGRQVDPQRTSATHQPVAAEQVAEPELS
jgi:stage V sporulation protein S